MFGNRRRGGSSNPPPNVSNASASATTAAAQAFLKNQASNASLSAAAAAAALRSRPTTPTSVADVQTKRTIKRSASVSSVGSSVAGSTRPQLQRRGSSGSMTERTFRDPSPNRPEHPVPSAPDAPPVPAIPKNIPSKAHRRATSMDAPAMRVASPPPNKATGRGSSLVTPKRAGQRSAGLSSVQELTGVERPASRGSVNFSLPTGSRPNSPLGNRRLTSPSPQRQQARIVSPTNQNLVYDPNTRSFLPEAELLAIEQRLYDAANKDVRKKKKVVPAAGSHLSQGVSDGRTRGTFVDAVEAAAKPTPGPVELAAPVLPVQKPVAAPVAVAGPEPIAQAPIRKKKKFTISDSDSDQGSYIPNSSDTDSDSTAPKESIGTRPATLMKKPSMVREDQEGEEREDDTPERLKPKNGPVLISSPASTRTISPSPLPRSVAGRGHGRGQASASAAFAQDRQQTRSASQPPMATETSGTNGVGLVTKDSVRGGRVQSVSPARTTHFANSPDSLLVKHQPPPRSISPRKSALKHNPSTLSPRGPSPIEGLSTNGLRGSEFSDASSVAPEDVPFPKKQRNRVSFDESNVLVGHAATPNATDSPVVASPQNRRSWFSIGRGKKKEATAVDEDDEVMKPRPALPSFGSVRERKVSRDAAEERPLVKPAEQEEAKAPLVSPPLFTTPTGEVVKFPHGSSNDLIVGSILSQDAATKNAANISKSREPLPPQVTSVEGSGYNSESDGSVYDSEIKAVDIGLGRANSVKRGPEGVDAETYRALTSPIPELDTPVEEKSETMVNGDVPRIAILSATPTLESTDRKGEWPDMPGGWGSGSTDGSSVQESEEPAPVVKQSEGLERSHTGLGIVQRSPTPEPISIPASDPSRSLPSPVTAIIEESEESDADVYSDAAEEISDTEGDGFMSLDAVVESPIQKTRVPAFALTTPPDSPTTRATKEKAYRKSQLSRKDSEPDLNAGWETVQAYWATLSADKKRRLEHEARETDESGSDTEVEAKPVPQQKKKKAGTQPISIIKPTLAPAPVIQGQTQSRTRETTMSPERTYMISPGAKAGPNGHAPPMRSSMRAESATAPGETHIRKSMRGEGSMRGSLRADAAPEPKGSLQKKYRPMSMPASGIKADPTAVSNHIKALSAASARMAPAAAQRDSAPPVPGLRRRGSGDSESSFKRARASSDAPQFRRSMRGSMDQESARGASPIRPSRFSLRSLSPTGSMMRRPFAAANGPPPVITSSPNHMRSSMRSYTSETPSLRTQKPQSKGGFGRSAAPKAKTSKFRSSRFADSSDEEDDRPTTFRSRFNDSSDDDEPVARSGGMARTMRSAPVRGIPKRAGVDDGDSSDLLDSDDEKPSSSALKLSKKRQNGHATSNKEGTELAAGTLRRSGSGRETLSSPVTTPSTRPANTRRGSFLSILRRKKPEQGSKVQKSIVDSPARRDTPLERSRSDLAALKQDRPSTPKLQKRNTSNSANWPLQPILPVPSSPPKILGGEDGRPFTADNGDGVVGGITKMNGDRPDFGTRRYTATGAADVDLGLQPRKKKKFPKLRKMLGLDD